MSPNLKMFISVCCAHCHSKTCDGVFFNTSFQVSCDKWRLWLSLSKDKQAQLFMKEAISEIELMEELTNE